MPQELIEMYNALSEAKQQSALDYVTYLYLRENKRSADEVDALLKEANDFAEQSGLQDWTLDEINDEIALCRAEKTFVVTPAERVKIVEESGESEK